MTIRHHPDASLLLDYATGALTDGWSLAIATHLALCPECRGSVTALEAVGGSLMLDLTKPPAETDLEISEILSRLDASAPDRRALSHSLPPTAQPILPEPLRSYVGGDASDLAWRRLGLGAYKCGIPLVQTKEVAWLLRIPVGRPVPMHSHGGMELTLVLAGAFDDDTGHYGRGDLQRADQTLEHRPHATAEADCICLAVTDAPLRFSGVFARLVQPFLGI